MALLDAIPFDFDGYELLDADYKLSYIKNDLQLAISKAAIEVHDLQLLEKKTEKSTDKNTGYCNKGHSV